MFLDKLKWSSASLVLSTTLVVFSILKKNIILLEVLSVLLVPSARSVLSVLSVQSALSVPFVLSILSVLSALSALFALSVLSVGMYSIVSCQMSPLMVSLKRCKIAKEINCYTQASQRLSDLLYTPTCLSKVKWQHASLRRSLWIVNHELLIT